MSHSEPPSLTSGSSHPVSFDPARFKEAAHEAGHGVLAVLLGRPLVHLSLEPEPETRLQTPTRLPKRKPSESSEIAHLEGEAMLALAGLVAERVMGLADAASLAASRSDLEVATRIATLTVGGARADKAIAHHLAVVER
ncbi:MAG: hypothetical protein AAFY60_22090, partial [Myxococcota bacterium]